MSEADMAQIIAAMRADGWTFRMVTTKLGTYVVRFEKRKFLPHPSDEEGDLVHTAEHADPAQAVQQAARLAKHGVYSERQIVE